MEFGVHLPVDVGHDEVPATARQLLDMLNSPKNWDLLSYRPTTTSYFGRRSWMAQCASPRSAQGRAVSGWLRPR
jgi:hypothetical protein